MFPLAVMSPLILTCKSDTSTNINPANNSLTIGNNYPITGGYTGWVHVSIADEPRRQVMTYDKTNGYRQGLIDGS